MEGQRHTPSSRVLKSVSNHKAKTQELSRCPWEMLSVEEALASLEQGPPPSVEDFACILQKCRKEKIPVNALRLHAYMRKFGLEAHKSLGNYLVPMLVEAGRIHDAQEVFDRLVYQNEYSWNSLLTGYIKCGKAQHALILYQKMQVDSLHPSGYTFVAVLKACAKLKDGERGREIHTEIVRKGLERDFFVGSTLVHMYAKCGLLAKAQEVFDELPVRDAVSWTSLIAGYAKLGHGQQALNCFEQMQLEGISPNPLTFACTLKACGSIGAVEKGQVIHAEIVRRALLEKDLLVGNAVVDMYAKCGLLAKAQEVFDKLPVRDVVSWNALTAGYAKHGGADEAFNCFEQMQVEGVSPDAVTFVCNLKACSSIGAMDKGREVHAEIAIKGFLEGDPFVGNALVDMYANCGLLAEAQEVFEKLGARDVVAWTALIAGYTKHGSGAEALSCFQQMQLSGVSPDAVTYVCSLKACSSIGATDKGQEIHAEIDRLRLLERHLNVGTALIDMYANCGLLAKAQEVFDKLPAQDVVSWNALIAGYSKHGCSKEALNCFEQMQLEGVSPDAVTFVCSLKACGSIGALDKGQEIHAEIVRQKLLERHLVVGNALVDMYASCGLLAKAQEVFDKLPVQDLVSWNVLITGYIKHGYFGEALNYFEKMQQRGVSPDAATFVCSMKACGSINAPDKCHELHAEIVRKGLLEKDLFVGIPLVEMFAQCGLLAKAQEVLYKLPVQNTVLWNALISGYANHAHGEEALNCFEHMQQEGIHPDAVTFVCSLKACGSIGASDEGQEIHAEIVRKGLLETDLLVGTALVDMYANCSLLVEAQEVFDKLLVRDVVSWNALISGYVRQGHHEEALNSFQRMNLEGISPDVITYVCSLNACGSIGAIDKGQEMHAEISRKGLLERDLVGNALVVMYVKCGLLAKAQEVFEKISVRDVVSWNALIAGYVKHDRGEEALDCFEQMQLEGVSPDAITLVCSLKACGTIGAIDKGREMHAEIIRRGLLKRDFVTGNALVDMYVKCGLLAEAREVFDKLSLRDVVSWNALIAGNANHRCGEEGLNCFKQMELEGVSPDAVTFICGFKACGSIGATDKGRELHSEIIKKGLLEANLIIGNALVDMHVDCGLLTEAQEVLKQLPFRDVISWTTLIAGYIKQGCSEEALSCLEQMQQEGVPSDAPLWNALIAGYAHLGQIEKAFHILDRMRGEGVKPDVDTFVSVLTACSHTGLVDKGQTCFEAMSKDYGINPTLEHYTCMVDLLGRAGQLDKAILLIKKMPFHPNLVAWHTLLGACRKWGNVVLGRRAFESALGLDEKDAAAYICMSNIYADNDMQEDVNMVWAMEETIT